MVAAWEVSKDATKKLIESLIVEINKARQLENEVESGRSEREQLEQAVTGLKSDLHDLRVKHQSRALSDRLKSDQQARQIQVLMEKEKDKHGHFLSDVTSWPRRAHGDDTSAEPADSGGRGELVGHGRAAQVYVMQGAGSGTPVRHCNDGGRDIAYPGSASNCAGATSVVG